MIAIGPGVKVSKDPMELTLPVCISGTKGPGVYVIHANLLMQLCRLRQMELAYREYRVEAACDLGPSSAPSILAVRDSLPSPTPKKLV